MPRCEHAWQYVPGGLPICTHCGREPHASPSQISTRRDCARKWAYSRQRPRPPDKPASAYGSRCHDIAQAWGETATAPDIDTPEGRTVASVLPYLPPPGAALHEHRATPTMGGIAWDMRLDWIDLYVPRVVVAIGDLKTTGNFEYAKSEEDLADADPQGVSYAHWAAEHFDVPRVILRWVYCERTKKPRPRPGFVRSVTVTREHAAAAFASIGREAYEMGADAWLPPEAFERSLDACSKYGGCEYREECHATINPLDLHQATLYTLRR